MTKPESTPEWRIRSIARILAKAVLRLKTCIDRNEADREPPEDAPKPPE